MSDGVPLKNYVKSSFREYRILGGDMLESFYYYAMLSEYVCEWVRACVRACEWVSQLVSVGYIRVYMGFFISLFILQRVTSVL